MGNILLDIFDDFSYQGEILAFVQRDVHLHAMISSAGLERRENENYDWHGSKRGNQKFSLIQYCCSGFGSLRVGDDLYRVDPGQAMLLNLPGDNRYWLPDDASHWEFIFIILSGRDISNFIDKINREHGPLVNLDPQSIAIETLESTIRQILNQSITSPYSGSALAYNLIMSFMHDLLPQGSSNINPMSELKQYCQENYKKQLSIDELAAYMDLSKYHFCRRFKEWEGITAGEYLNQLRLKEASRLLRYSDSRIGEISNECGFSDPNYFAKVFRKAFDMSPSDYRKSGL
ncbi:MAG: helix-turn-helix transcriptional regulator [Lentisphaeria bacterium]|nr:AraC family transcriptional regulator [Lentisphaeria bacterium]NQZ67796.1 helix-turn-helix transcriptional regulator [Lentisphaeria bacterium]